MEDTTLRDRMALERTFLSYLRTALGFYLAGLTALHVFNMFILGASLGFLGIVFFSIGYYRFRSISSSLGG